jgi:hypothetical protein
MTTNIVQYVIVRKDVLKTFKWPVSALIAQACRACTAVILSRLNIDINRIFLFRMKNAGHQCMSDLKYNRNNNEKIKIFRHHFTNQYLFKDIDDNVYL